MKERKLTPSQRLFVREYLKDLNGTQAYLRVYGGGDKSAEANSCRLIRNDRIKVEIEKGLAKLADYANITAERNMKRIAEWAYHKSIKPSDSLKACELLGRILGQFKDGSPVVVNVPITNEIKRDEFKKKKKDFDDECG